VNDSLVPIIFTSIYNVESTMSGVARVEKKQDATMSKLVLIHDDVEDVRNDLKIHR